MTQAKSQRKRNKATKAADRIKFRLKKEESFRKAKLLAHKPGEEKISEVVMRLVEPFTHDEFMETQWKALIELTFAGWNVSLLPPDERKATIDELVNERTIFMPEDTKRAIYEMIERKERDFADYGQLLVSYDLTMTGKGPYLTVAFLIEDNHMDQGQ
jgi:hypothetical protein